MSDVLVKRVAEVIWGCEFTDEEWDARERLGFKETARFAIAAINNSGTHVVVPVELTNEMLLAFGKPPPKYPKADYWLTGESVVLRYKAMLAAARQEDGG